MQEFIVVLVLFLAIWLICQQYMPNRMRALNRLLLQSLAKRLGWKKLTDKLEQGEFPSSSNCCSSCKACGLVKKDSSCETPVILHNQNKKS